MHSLPLIGIAVIAGGFLLRFNPLLVVLAAGAATRLAAGLDPLALLRAFGKAFNDARYVTVIYIVLPVIGLMERHGLQDRARALVASLKGATTGRLLIGYLLFRQVTAALGLISIAGHAQTVRPLVAPMAEAAAPPDADAERVKAMAAATDNVGVFFGEDIFLAIGSILLMKGVLEGYGILLEPFQLSLWAIPAAIAAFLIHGARLIWFDRGGTAAMIGLTQIYAVAGATFLAFAILSLRAASAANTGFHALIALSFWAGDRIGDAGNGVLVLALVAIAATGRMGGSRSPDLPAEVRAAEAARRGNRLFLPMLIVPAVAVAGTLAFKHIPALVETRQATLVALTLGVLVALAAGYAWLRPRPATPFAEGLRLMDAVGWAAVLPQMLVALGAVFALAGVGEIVGGLIGQAIPAGSLFGAVLAYGLGMALFTIVMGNAFAAFPVMATAVGVPLLIRAHGGDPAIVAAMGMLAGFCGTLMTPMAANYNLVPAALLELKDRYGVIRAQIPTALPLLAVNIALIWLLAFRR